jgi:hypothetical protein
MGIGGNVEKIHKTSILDTESCLTYWQGFVTNSSLCAPPDWFATSPVWRAEDRPLYLSRNLQSAVRIFRFSETLPKFFLCKGEVNRKS